MTGVPQTCWCRAACALLHSNPLNPPKPILNHPGRAWKGTEQITRHSLGNTALARFFSSVLTLLWWRFALSFSGAAPSPGGPSSVIVTKTRPVTLSLPSLQAMLPKFKRHFFYFPLYKSHLKTSPSPPRFRKNLYQTHGSLLWLGGGEREFIARPARCQDPARPATSKEQHTGVLPEGQRDGQQKTFSTTVIRWESRPRPDSFLGTVSISTPFLTAASFPSYAPTSHS